MAYWLGIYRYNISAMVSPFLFHNQHFFFFNICFFIDLFDSTRRFQCYGLKFYFINMFEKYKLTNTIKLKHNKWLLFYIRLRKTLDICIYVITYHNDNDGRAESATTTTTTFDRLLLFVSV